VNLRLIEALDGFFMMLVVVFYWISGWGSGSRSALMGVDEEGWLQGMWVHNESVQGRTYMYDFPCHSVAVTQTTVSSCKWLDRGVPS
jgi:hypothetical protein